MGQVNGWTADLTPAKLCSLLLSMGQALRKLHHPQRATLHRPVVAIGPLQNYCVDPDFATVAAATMFGDSVWRRLLNMIGLQNGLRPVRNPVSKPPGRSSTL